MYEVKEVVLSDELMLDMEERDSITLNDDGEWVVVYPEPRELNDFFQVVNTR